MLSNDSIITTIPEEIRQKVEELKYIKDEEKELFLSDLVNLEEEEMLKWINEFKEDFGK